ncbi:hypothetical protein ACOBQB_00940 [Streptomyces sp. G5(2025)]|uniref:hypothetical protein n=1 Tax=Streptomyces sp. G5(2025) TaxID=3406628 RepID=UPI003C29D10F
MAPGLRRGPGGAGGQRRVRLGVGPGDYDGDGDTDVTVGVYNEDSTEYEQNLSAGGVWTLPNGAGAGSKALTARLFGLRGALDYGRVLGR